MRFRRTLAVALCGCALAGAACGGSHEGDAPDSSKIPTATLPAELPPPMIVGGGVVQPGGGSSYTIKAGDTLAGVAERFGVSLEDLLATNPGVNPGTLHAGDSIKLPPGTDVSNITPQPGATEVPTEAPAPTEPPPTEEPAPTSTPSSLGQTYIVKEGDIPGTIAAQFGITVEALLAANPGVNPNNLHIGDVLVIPPAPTATP